jgi:hypothetical protein
MSKKWEVTSFDNADFGLLDDSDYKQEIQLEDNKKYLVINDNLQSLVDCVLDELENIKNRDFDVKNANSTAAAALQAQVKLADHLANLEFNAKNAKNELKFIEANVAIDLRDNSDKKITEAHLNHLIEKESKYKEAKDRLLESEREFKKWDYIYNTVKEAHIFFRNIDKKG